MKNVLIISVCFLTLFTTSCVDKSNGAKPVARPNSPYYQTAIAAKGNLKTSLRLPAQLMAYQEVSIFPKVNGYVKEVLVDIGSHVHTGQLLMTLEAPEMREELIAAKEKYARSEADYSISREDYSRLLVASRTSGAISPLDLSATKAKMSADSSFSNAEKANWGMQQAMNSYLSVTAPFDGVITERDVNPGSLVSATSKDALKSMLELKQIKKLRLTIDVPESISERLKDNDTIRFTVSAIPGKEFVARVSRKAMNIDAQYRVEKTEADVDNPNEELKPGMYADVNIKLDGNDNALIVPRSSVVTSTENKYVLVVRNKTIVPVDVTTGNQDLDNTEVFGAVQPGDSVIVNANDQIKPGTVL